MSDGSGHGTYHVGESEDEAVALFGGATPAARVAGNRDWSTTPLGPVRGWPEELRVAVAQLMPCEMAMNLMWGPDLVQIYNQANLVLLGGKHPRAMGLPARDTWPEVWSQIGPLMQEVLDRGVSLHRVDAPMIIDRYGYPEETYWTFSYSPLRGPEARVGGLLAAAQETTEGVLYRRRMDTLHDLAALGLDPVSLERAAQRVVAVLEQDRFSVPFVAIYRAAPDGELHLLAGSGADPLSPYLPERISATSSHPYSRCWRDRRDVCLEDLTDADGLLPGPLGPARPHRVRVLPLEGTDPGVAGVIALGANPYRPVDVAYQRYLRLIAEHVTTILERSRVAAASTERTGRLREIDAQKTQFYQDVSHELRTPLTLLRLAIDHLAQGRRSPSLAAHLTTASQATQQLERLVDALLVFVTAERNVLRPTVERVDVAAVTQAVVGMFHSAADSAGLSLRTDLESVGTVLVDREGWGRIVANLVSNAVKYTDIGGVTVRLQRSGDVLSLVVSDTGIGIPAEEHAAVFDRFHRTPRSMRGGRQGVGIGLPLVADLVRAHGGTVDVESLPGQGCAFTVQLPIPPEQVPAGGDEVAPDVAGHPVRGGDAATVQAGSVPRSEEGGVAPLVAGLLPRSAQPWRSEPPAGAEHGHVLLVEDDEQLRGYLVGLLTEAGWRVSAVPDVSAALQLSLVPDLVLSDVTLPGRSGLELLRSLRERAGWERLPFILLTARAGTESVVEGLAAGADDYVIKPFDPRELLARMRVHRQLSVRREAALTSAETRAEDLAVALGSNRRIGMALGIVMARYHLTEGAAFDRMRELSNATNRKLRDLADAVILTGILPDPPR